MTNFFRKLHGHVGDLWWYSAMIFIACRSGDLIQAFIGIWLVPRYVGEKELGAVLPLLNLSSFLTIPLGIIAIVFSKYVNTYATRNEYAKVKGFIRDVFVASLILFLLCIGGAVLILPFFYERLRITSGSLTFLILVCGLVTNLGAIVSSAQQGLKRFKMISAMTLIGAPIRLLTLLVTMPIRALSGYILGQATPIATTSFLSVLDIRKTLKPYRADSSWRKDIPEIWRYFWPYAICALLGSLCVTLTTTIYRQRLPEIESSAYYILSRFAEIATYLGMCINTIIIPLASESHERQNESRRTLHHAVLGSVISSAALAVLFHFTAPTIFSLSETWALYKPYLPLLPIMTFGMGLWIATGSITLYEFACRRIGPTVVVVVLNTLWTLVLLVFTGHGHFHGILPAQIATFMANAHLDNLTTLTWYGFFAANVLQFVAVLSFVHFRGKKNS